jgi:hypothetical protein
MGYMDEEKKKHQHHAGAAMIHQFEILARNE